MHGRPDMAIVHIDRSAGIDEIAAEMDRRGAVIEKLEREKAEAIAYLKAFVFATIDPADKRADAQVHQANPSLGWYFTVNDTGLRGHREILGGQVRRAMEIVGFDKLKIEAPETTVADDLIAQRRRLHEALASRDAVVLAGKHLALKLADVYRAARQQPADCQAIRDWMAALAKAGAQP